MQDRRTRAQGHASDGTRAIRSSRRMDGGRERRQGRTPRKCEPLPGGARWEPAVCDRLLREACCRPTALSREGCGGLRPPPLRFPQRSRTQTGRLPAKAPRRRAEDSSGPNEGEGDRHGPHSDDRKAAAGRAWQEDEVEGEGVSLGGKRAWHAPAEPAHSAAGWREERAPHDGIGERAGTCSMKKTKSEWRRTAEHGGRQRPQGPRGEGSLLP